MKSKKEQIEYRVERCAWFIIENEATIRETAKHFGISKSTVYEDMTERLPRYSTLMYQEVRRIFEINKMERTRRGGEATRKKYQLIKENCNFE